LSTNAINAKCNKRKCDLNWWNDEKVAKGIENDKGGIRGDEVKRRGAIWCQLKRLMKRTD
jgi:hypothetical protein